MGPRSWFVALCRGMARSSRWIPRLYRVAGCGRALVVLGVQVAEDEVVVLVEAAPWVALCQPPSLLGNPSLNPALLSC